MILNHPGFTSVVAFVYREQTGAYIFLIQKFNECFPANGKELYRTADLFILQTWRISDLLFQKHLQNRNIGRIHPADPGGLS